MSIFTKIFVVLNMVAAVLLVGLVVAFVTNVETYKDKFNAAQAQAQTFQLQAKVREADNLAAVMAATAAREQLQKENEALRSELNIKDQALLTNQADIVALRAENANFKTDLAKLSGGSQKDSEIIASLNEELRKRRDRETQLSAENIDLSRQVNEKTAEVTELTQYGRFLSETIADLEKQNADLATRADSRTGVAARDNRPPGPLTTGVVPDHPIRAMVTDLEKIGDGTFITLSVGRNDGVREGMEFVIYKDGDKYLGDALVMVVDLNTSAARVTLQQGEIVPDEAEALAGGEP